MKVTHHQDKCIESLSDLFGLFQVRRYLKYQFVSGKANFVVGQNRRNVPRIRAPFGSRLKMTKNSGKSRIRRSFTKLESMVLWSNNLHIPLHFAQFDWTSRALSGLVNPWVNVSFEPGHPGYFSNGSRDYKNEKEKLCNDHDQLTVESEVIHDQKSRKLLYQKIVLGGIKL